MDYDFIPKKPKKPKKNKRSFAKKVLNEHVIGMNDNNLKKVIISAMVDYANRLENY